jgi:hypothetical protein
VAAVEGLQDPGDAADLAVEVLAPVFRQRPRAEVLGRWHPPASPSPSRGNEEAQGNPEMQEAALLCSRSGRRRRGGGGGGRRCHLWLPRRISRRSSGGRPRRRGNARASLRVGEHQSRRPQPPDCCCLSHSRSLPSFSPPGSS